jgi:hypothetical protein
MGYRLDLDRLGETELDTHVDGIVVVVEWLGGIARPGHNTLLCRFAVGLGRVRVTMAVGMAVTAVGMAMTVFLATQMEMRPLMVIRGLRRAVQCVNMRYREPWKGYGQRQQNSEDTRHLRITAAQGAASDND